MDEFLKLIKEVMEEENLKENDEVWIPSTPKILEKYNKSKILLSNRNSSIDVSNMKKHEIITYIKTRNEFIIDNFIIHVDNSNKENYVNVHILEKQHKTASGFPCNMLVKVNVLKDKRFSSCPWISYFYYNTKYGRLSTKTAIDVPIKELINIIKWVKAINKMTAFL